LLSLWRFSLLKNYFKIVLVSFILPLGLSHATLCSAESPVTPTGNTNALNLHASPYLAMHGQDPVNWLDWNADVLKKAKADNKLIFISSGYFSCHWCHVMQRENYQNEQTASYLNEHFMAVKIDRELNPELDKTLIEFAQKATGQAGWPQHVVLTPEGYPFAAFVYLPNTAFNKRLHKIVDFWEQDPDRIRQIAESSITKSRQPTAVKIDRDKFAARLLQQLEVNKDALSGGLMGSTKFPQAPLLKAVLHYKRLPDPIQEWLQFSLDQMQSLHLFDHVHGGFYRYTIDPEWQTPHFEKMAYTNALLADVYLQAGQKYHRPDYLATAKATLDYLQQHLYNPETLLYQSSQSAIDSQSVEGGDYLWSKQALQKALSAQEFIIVNQAWSLESTPPYDQGWHPLPTAKYWPSIQKKLQTHPKKIPIDSKSILGWNGLILSALSRASQVLKQPHYLKQANQLAERLMALIQQPNAPRALSKNGSFMGEANLQDYAFIYQGIKDWQQLTQQTKYTEEIKKLEKTIVEKFYTDSGWQYHYAPLLPGQQGEWQMADDAIPSPAALVSCLKPDSMRFAGTTLMKNPVNYASYLQAIEIYQQ
jgi:uncharacterized protein YyaL (SSP411 family)